MSKKIYKMRLFMHQDLRINSSHNKPMFLLQHGRCVLCTCLYSHVTGGSLHVCEPSASFQRTIGLDWAVFNVSTNTV